MKGTTNTLGRGSYGFFVFFLLPNLIGKKLIYLKVSKNKYVSAVFNDKIFVKLGNKILIFHVQKRKKNLFCDQTPIKDQFGIAVLYPPPLLPNMSGGYYIAESDDEHQQPIYILSMF